MAVQAISKTSGDLWLLAAARTLKVPEETVRWLKGKDIQAIGANWIERPMDLLAYLTLLCPEHRPQTAEDWNAFNHFVQAIDQLRDARQDRFDPGISFFHQQWLRELGKTGWRAALKRFDSIDAVPADLTTIPAFLRDISVYLAQSLSKRGEEEVLELCISPYVEKVFFSKGIIHQVRASIKWHRAPLMQEAGGNGACGSPLSWPAAFDERINCQCLWAICLTNRYQLIAEGAQMGHCVGDYADRCLFSGSTIVSMRGYDWKPRSTAELVLTRGIDDSLHFELRQHRGVGNSRPAQDAEMAMRMIVSQLNSLEFAARRTLLHDALQKRRALRRAASAAGDNPWRLSRLREALKFHVGYERFRQEADLATNGIVTMYASE